MGKAATTTTTITDKGKPRSPQDHTITSINKGCKTVLTSDIRMTLPKFDAILVCDKVMPTNTNAMGTKALPSNCKGLSTTGCRPNPPNLSHNIHVTC